MRGPWDRQGVLALLWLVGSVLTISTLLVPYEVDVDTTARTIVASLALGLALFLWRAPRLPDGALHGVLAVGAGAVAYCTHLGAPEVESVMFLLPVAYAFATFAAVAALPHLGLCVGLLALVLFSAPDEKTVAPWVSFLLVAGVAATTSFALAKIFGVREREQESAARDRHIARELQRMLLPTRLPDVPGASLASRYLPAAEEADVGGDFYDAFVGPSGRLVLCVGDVAGKGLVAARATGGLRSAVQAYAMVDDSPDLVLDRLDRFAAAHAPMATMLLVVLDPATGVLEWASAGHPPPLRLAADGTSAEYLAGAPGAPLTTEGGQGPPRRHVHRLAEGEGLLLFTDGLIERRGEGLDAGMRRLAAAAQAAGPLPLPVLLDVLLPLVPRPLQDDVTALVVRRVPEQAPEPASELASPGVPAELTGLRPTPA